MTKKSDTARKHTGDRTRTSRRPSRAASPSPAHEIEILYASPGAAKRAFRMEREENPRYRRCPTPHVSQSRRVASSASLRITNTARESGSGGSGNVSAETVTPFTGGLERYDPNDNVEIISGPLGRKKPKHRTLLPGILRPALRSVTHLGLESDPPRPLEPPAPAPHRRAEKPLPSRPMSIITSGMNNLMRMAPRPSASMTLTNSSLARSHSRSSVYSSDQRANPISNFFSSLSVGSPSPSTSRYRRTRETILPADNLHDYLRLADLPSWDHWPEGAGDAKWAMFGGGGHSDSASWKNTGVGWEWLRRLEDAEQERLRGRSLAKWEGPDRHWEKNTLDFLESNIPHHPVPSATRWGSQIFALHASGYDTVEFYDEDAAHSEDLGLLSWLNGSVLQTAISAVHMLREASAVFAFHIIPSPRPATQPAPRRDPHRDSSSYLWEGFGTMVMVNRSDESDRAMIISVRPPSILTNTVLREFASTGRTSNRDGWRHLVRDFAESDVGQANLLQAQVYDDCVRNQAYFFAVTNLKQWVLGSFNSTYTKASLSPVIDRKSRDPSVMQCLTASLVRAFDARPRRHPRDDQPSHRLRHSSSRSDLRQRASQSLRSDVAPPYPGPPRSRAEPRRLDHENYDEDRCARRDRSRHISAPPPSSGPGEWGQTSNGYSNPMYPADAYYDMPQNAAMSAYQPAAAVPYQQYPTWTGHEMYPAQTLYSASPVPAYSAHSNAYADPRWGLQPQMDHLRTWS